MLRDPAFKPEKDVEIPSVMVTPDVAPELYKKLTVEGQ